MNRDELERRRYDLWRDVVMSKVSQGFTGKEAVMWANTVDAGLQSLSEKRRGGK